MMAHENICNSPRFGMSMLIRLKATNVAFAREVQEPFARSSPPALACITHLGLALTSICTTLFFDTLNER